MTQEERLIEISPFAILAAVLLLAAGVVAFRSIRQSAERTYAVPQTGAYAEAQSSATPDGGKTVSKGGVDLTILAVERNGNETAVTVSMDNHQYDLADDAIAERAFLDGMPAKRMTVLTAASGGHHVQAKFIFDGTDGRKLIIGATDELVFEFDLA